MDAGIGAYSPKGVMTAAAKDEGSKTFVASVAPPKPASTTAKSTLLFAKCLLGWNTSVHTHVRLCTLPEFWTLVAMDVGRICTGKKQGPSLKLILLY